MSRFNKVATLRSVELTIDEWGRQVEEATDAEVFVNEWSMGATAFLAARSAGLHADASLSLRSCDYAGQQRAVLDGVEYDVERVDGRGDFVRLTLRRRLADG